MSSACGGSSRLPRRWIQIMSAFLALGLGLPAEVALGQVSTGTISGRITDPGAAGVPGAKIRLMEQQTGVIRTASADDTGFYVFPLVPVGIYQLTIEAPGFKVSEQKDMRLEVNQNLTVPVRLELGTVTESVLVQASPPQVDTVSSSVKEVVDRTSISELPLNGRNVLQLQQLVNGAVLPARAISSATRRPSK